MQAGSNAGQYNNGIMSENLDHIYKLLSISTMPTCFFMPRV